MKYKSYILLSLVLLYVLQSFLSTPKAVEWGFFGHKRINRIAVFTLPPEMFGFYKEHIEFVTEHAVDPDKRRYAVEGEAQCHYIDLDHYYKPGENPFEIMPRKWKDAVSKFTEDTLQTYGIVPWHISVMKTKLQRAFETKNVDLILKYSADIGHYIADAHVPLHTTENYNGQFTGQKGIKGLWESRLVEINAENYNYFVGKATYVKSVLDYTWEVIEASHNALDSVLRMEKEITLTFPSDRKYAYEQRGNTTVQVYSKEFCSAYHAQLNGMVERRLRAAVIAVGSIWYTAWVDAGQPDLRSLQNKPPTQELLKEFQALEEHFHNDQHKGRICE
ncbi:MAG: zinc dependent phospholipase C family protein [Crocinitomicaceae bacterium]